MKFSEFSNVAEMLEYFGLRVQNGEFIDFDTIKPIKIPAYLKQDIRFVLSERGDTDRELLVSF